MASTDARPIPIKNTAYRVTFPILDADGDLVTGAASLDSEVSKDGGTFADCTNEATEIATSSGMYYLDLTSTEMNADCVAVIVKTATSGAKTTPMVFYPNETGDIDVDVTAYGGTAGTFASGRPEVNTSHIAGSAVSTSSAQIGVNVVNAAGTAWGSGAITAASIATDAITSAKIAADAIGASEIADGAIDRATFAADTGLQSIRSNTAQAGAAGTITLDASASSTTDFYKYCVIYTTGGTGAGQFRLCTAYNGTTKVATVVPNWITNPASDTTFAVRPFGITDVEAIAAAAVSTSSAQLGVNLVNIAGAAVSTSTAQIGANVVNFGGSAGTFASGRPEVNTSHIAGSAVSTSSAQIGVNVVNAGGTAWGSGAITAASIATDAITSAKIAADAIGDSEVASDVIDAIWAKAMTELSSVPGVTASVLDAIRWLFVLSRNKITQTATTQLLRNDADGATIGTSTVSDDGTTFIRGEFA